MAELKIWQGGTCKSVHFAGETALHVLLEQAGFAGLQPCGGRGVCGKCAVTLEGCVSLPNRAEQKAGTRLACQAVILGDAEVFLPEEQKLSRIQMDAAVELRAVAPMEGKLGAVIDLGTTTLAAKVFDLAAGVCLGSAAMTNPQCAVAADVMGRIDAAIHGKLPLLQSQILGAVEELLRQAGGTEADQLVLTGNTTMLYLLTGRDPECLSHAPFEADTLFDVQTQVCGRRTYLPPCMNAFVGADISCAVLASEMCGGGTALLCDVGTNGELALWKDGILYVTSTAAGPAFEGAGISCGCGSVPGAIDHVWAEDGQLRCHTIDDMPAVGLCGSGLLSAAAALLEAERMDETGALEEDEVELAPGVRLLQRDIRAMQLAKAAIAAGIQTLLGAAEVCYNDVETCYLAGGFGSHLHIPSAAAIGLIPNPLASKVKILGNAALAGAAQLLLDREKLAQVRQIAAVSRHWNLGGNPKFNEAFVEDMFFETIG